MSLYTRLASTNEQEESIKAVEKAFKKAGRRIVGHTTIGKSPQTVILDAKHHGSDVYINADGVIKIHDSTFENWDSDIEDMALKIQLLTA